MLPSTSSCPAPRCSCCRPAERKAALLSPWQPICVTHSLHPVQHLLRGAPSSIPKAKEESAVVHTSFVLVVLHCFQHLEGFGESCNALAPSPSARHPARPAFRVQSSVPPHFPSPQCPNQAQTHLGGRQLTVKHPNSLCPAPLPALPLLSQAIPSPGASNLHTCRSGHLTHLLHSSVHPIGVSRGEMGQHSGAIDAFPEKGVMLEGSQREVSCTTQCQNAKAQPQCSLQVPKISGQAGSRNGIHT